MVKGIHKEVCETTASKVMQATLSSRISMLKQSSIDSFLSTSEHYSLLLDAINTLQQMADSGQAFFRDDELDLCRDKLKEAARMLEIKVYNYKMLEKY